MITIGRAAIDRAAAGKVDPAGYLAAVDRLGVVDGATVKFTELAFAEIRKRFPPRKEPTPAKIVANFGASLARFIRRGCPTVGKAQFAARMAICEACEHWRPKAYAGLGKCEACGCSKAKLALATESCPVGKWRRLDALQN